MERWEIEWQAARAKNGKKTPHRGRTDLSSMTEDEKKEYKRAYQRAYNKAHKAERNAYIQAYREANKERVQERDRERYRAYYAQHKQEIAERRKRRSQGVSDGTVGT